MSFKKPIFLILHTFRRLTGEPLVFLRLLVLSKYRFLYSIGDRSLLFPECLLSTFLFVNKILLKTQQKSTILNTVK